MAGRRIWGVGPSGPQLHSLGWVPGIPPSFHRGSAAGQRQAEHPPLFKNAHSGVPAEAKRKVLGCSFDPPPGIVDLRIQCGHGLGHNCGLDLILGLGTPSAAGRPRKKKKKKPTPSLATTDWLEGRFVTPPVSRFRLESWNWSKCSRPVVVGVGR